MASAMKERVDIIVLPFLRSRLLMFRRARRTGGKVVAGRLRADFKAEACGRLRADLNADAGGRYC